MAKVVARPSAQEEWRERYQSKDRRPREAETISGVPLDPLYAPSSVPEGHFETRQGYPGAFPYTRGVYPSMYRDKLWTMRQFSGFGSAQDTNQRYKFLLSQGQ